MKIPFVTCNTVRRLLLGVFIWTCVASSAQCQHLFTTFAGSAGELGETDGTTTQARFRNPTGIARDAAGNLYVADTGGHVIRKVTPAGEVSTFAGLGDNAGSADGTGSAARFSYPWGVAVDANGNVFVSDSGNYTIRKITPAGIVTTIAGTAGESGSMDGLGATARFARPAGMGLDSAGNLYVSDYSNSTVRKITPAGQVTTIAGVPGEFGHADGSGMHARFNYPDGVAIDRDNNVYVVDTNNHIIRRITPAGDVSTVAGQPGVAGTRDSWYGPALLNTPIGIAIDDLGRVFITERGSLLVRRMSLDGFVTTIGGTQGERGAVDGLGDAARFNELTGIVVGNDGHLFITDTYNQTIRTASYIRPTAGDFDGDGKADLVWRNVAGGNYAFWLMNGATPHSYLGKGVMPLEWEIVGSGDFSGIGRTDLVWRNTSTGMLAFWLMNGTDIASGLATQVVPLEWRFAATGDFDGDDQTDILWQDDQTGEVRVWLMNGVRPRETLSLGAVPPEWHLIGVGDFNHDGQSDFVWRNQSSGDLAFWLMNGLTAFDWINLGSVPLEWEVSGIGDLDGDGSADLIWRDQSTGTFAYWLMDGTTPREYLARGTMPLEWQITM